MASAEIAGLHLCNQKMKDLLDRLQAENSSLITPQHFEELLEALLSSANWLHGTAPEDRRTNPELSREVAEYRRNLEQIRQILPVIQGRLLTERARLEAERTHLAAAAAWAQSSKRIR